MSHEKNLVGWVLSGMKHYVEPEGFVVGWHASLQKCIGIVPSIIIKDVFQVTPPDEPAGTKILRLSILLMEKKHAPPEIYRILYMG